MNLRQRILEAAEQVIRANGLARTTTKDIAHIAGCSEGSLYNHFRSKEDLFLHVLRGQLPPLLSILMALSKRVGQGTVKENLKEVLVVALEYFHDSVPMLSSVFSEPGLLARHREGFLARNEGPHRTNDAVAAYLDAEVKAGRMVSETNPRVVADLLLGACFQHAFHIQFCGENETREEQEQYVEQLLNSFLDPLLADG